MANIQPLLTPVRSGELTFPNRVVMAPLTRMRAANPGHVATGDLQGRYYAQRASAGLIISEGIAISPDGYGWADSPGLWSSEQVAGWRGVTEAVHQRGGRIFAQLWHTGAISHPDFHGGELPMSSSAVDPRHESVTPTGKKPTVMPRPMSRDDIRRTVAEFRHAARNAMAAGFDGVQIQANYLYLITQFLNSATNLRTDEYGGSIENRARFFFQVLEGVLAEVDAGRVGVKLGPMNEVGAFAANEDTLPTHEYVIRKLNDYKLAHLLIMGATSDFAATPLAALAGDGMFRHFRNIFAGTLIANVGMTPERGNRLIAEGVADMIAFGRSYIANPDLVARIAAGAKKLATINWSTVYASGAEGYTDYPEATGIISSTPRPTAECSSAGADCSVEL